MKGWGVGGVKFVESKSSPLWMFLGQCMTLRKENVFCEKKDWHSLTDLAPAHNTNISIILCGQDI